MLKIKIISVGKTKEAWLDAAIADYVERLQATIEIECMWVKNDEALLAAVKKEPLVVCLDAGGRELSSEAFSAFLFQKLEQGGSRLATVIGGAEGLPQELKSGYPLLSLSQMTLTHQIARLVLIEQIYRASEIVKGTRYHK